MARRRPVPIPSRCEPTILREARYWRSAFRGVLGVDDLAQEGWLVALRALARFDPGRGAQIETLLTLMLRQHYRRLLRRVHRRPLRAEPPPPSRAELENQGRARSILARLRMLPPGQQRLARLLVECDGRVAQVARRAQWPLHTTRARVLILRRALSQP